LARVHGANADFSFDSIAMESWLNSVTLNFSVPEAEITSFSDVYGNYLAGKPTATIDIAGAWDGAVSGPDVTIFGELGLEGEEYDFEPDGTTGYDGFSIVTAYSITASVDAPVTFSASFRHNGGAAAADAAAPTRA